MAAFDFVTVRDSFYTLIDAQLTTTVYKYPPGDQTIDRNTTSEVYEWVWLGEIRVDREILTFGASGLREDNILLEGRIVVEAPGKTDTQASAAETRAVALLNLIETGLVGDDDLSGEVLVGTIVDVKSVNGVTDRGRATEIEFTVEFQAHNA